MFNKYVAVTYGEHTELNYNQKDPALLLSLTFNTWSESAGPLCVAPWNIRHLHGQYNTIQQESTSASGRPYQVLRLLIISSETTWNWFKRMS